MGGSDVGGVMGTPVLGRPEHSRKRWCACALTRSPADHGRMVGLGRDWPGLAYWAPAPQGTDRQTGHNRRPPPPRQNSCHRVGCSHSTARIGSPDPSRPALAHRSEPVSPVPRPCDPSCRRRPYPPSSCPRTAFRQGGGKSLAGTHQRRPAGVFPPIGPPRGAPDPRTDHRRRRSLRQRDPRQRGRRQGRRGRRPGRVEHRQVHQERQEVRGPGPELRRTGRRGLQPQGHVDEGESGSQGRQHLHLPRPRQRASQPVRRVLRGPQGRPRPEQGPEQGQQQHQVLRRGLRQGQPGPGAQLRGHPQSPVLRVGQLRMGSRQPEQGHRQEAGRQLRRRLPAGRRPGGLRQRHRQRLVDHPRPAHDRT